MNSNVAIVWFRDDLRVSDNPALHAAIRHGRVVPVFIWSPAEEGDWPPGGASRWWLHQSLQSLKQQLRELGSRLIIKEGPSQATLGELVEATGASAVFWNRRYEPAVVPRDLEVLESLSAEGILAESLNGGLLFEPGTIANKSGRAFQVFTPFWKACLSRNPGPVLPTLRKIPGPRTWPDSLELAALGLEPRIDWASGIQSAWKPGCDGAKRRLQAFVRDGLRVKLRELRSNSLSLCVRLCTFVSLFVQRRTSMRARCGVLTDESRFSAQSIPPASIRLECNNGGTHRSLRRFCATPWHSPKWPFLTPSGQMRPTLCLCQSVSSGGHENNGVGTAA